MRSKILQHAERNPLAAGYVELSQAGIEEFGRGKSVEQAADQRREDDTPAVRLPACHVPGGALVEHQQEGPVRAKDKRREQQQIAGKDEDRPLWSAMLNRPLSGVNV